MKIPEVGLNSWMRETVWPRGTILPTKVLNEGLLWEQFAGLDERDREAPWTAALYNNLRQPLPRSPAGASAYTMNVNVIGAASGVVSPHTHVGADILTPVETEGDSGVFELATTPVWDSPSLKYKKVYLTVADGLVTGISTDSTYTTILTAGACG